MTTQITLDNKTPSQTPPSPRTPVSNIGSLPVTDVFNGNNLQATEKNTADAMQTLQRQQTQPVIESTLSPTRVNTSIADDLDALLNETLDEFCMRDTTSSSSTVQSTADVSLDAFLLENGFHMGLMGNLMNMEEFLIKVASIGLGDMISSFTQAATNEIVEITKQVDKNIEMINLCFKSLLQSANPSIWLERESKTPFYRNCHIFSVSSFLITTIDQTSYLQDHLNSKQATEWKENYQKCIILLKKHGLDQYVEAEFPFSMFGKLALNMVKSLNNDEIKSELTKASQDPRVAERMQRFENGDNPMAIMADMAQQDPQFAQMMQDFGNGNDPMGMMAQNPQFAEMMQGFGNGNPMEMLTELFKDPQFVAEMMKELGNNNSTNNPQMLKLQGSPLVSFFKELDQVLTQNSKDAEAVETWLKGQALKPTYQYPFFFSKTLLMRLPFDDVSDLTLLRDSCCEQLSVLGLQRYAEEPCPKHALDALNRFAVEHKDKCQLELANCLSFLRPLAIKLKELNFTTEECAANRVVIENWIEKCKTEGSYYPPFVASLDLCDCREAFEDVLDKAMLEEINVLLPFCRERLVTLDLSKYVFEVPQTLNSTNETDDIVITTKKALSDTERLRNEIAFFKAMIQQDDNALDQWLKETSPNFDYPLLWANKRFSQISRYRDKVDMNLRLEWNMCADTCLERIKHAGLNHHLVLPENASSELSAFIQG